MNINQDKLIEVNECKYRNKDKNRYFKFYNTKSKIQ